MINISKNQADILFRGLFCLIFIGLGAEHLVDDTLIQKLMPAWVPMPHLVSLLSGAWLMLGGLLILLGWQLRFAALWLATFLIIVTVAVHLPGVVTRPIDLPIEWQWTWDILQRTNLVKNLCLLGVCFHLLHHEPGKYSLTHYLKRSR